MTKLGQKLTASPVPDYGEPDTDSDHYKYRTYFLTTDGYDFSGNDAVEITGGEASTWIPNLQARGREEVDAGGGAADPPIVVIDWGFDAEIASSSSTWALIGYRAHIPPLDEIKAGATTVNGIGSFTRKTNSTSVGEYKLYNKDGAVDFAGPWDIPNAVGWLNLDTPSIDFTSMAGKTIMIYLRRKSGAGSVKLTSGQLLLTYE